jgi:mannose-1-phosphate guanylyltransferase
MPRDAPCRSPSPRQSDLYAVILAGGGGTRLWPLSSPGRPKPFLPLLGERTLLQLTADRLKGLVDPDSVFVVTDQRYARLVGEQLPDATVLAEPIGRNTAPAIALATVAIDRADDEVMLVLPADQTVERAEAFAEVLRDAERDLARGAFGLAAPLVTLGVQPTRPATEFGYLIPDLDQHQAGRIDAYRLKSFQEKPSIDRATELLVQPGVAWNAGMFMWQRRAIRAALQAFASRLLDPIELAFGSGALVEIYSSIESISIDYAVMEPGAAAGQVVMGSMDVGWNDLGSWTSLLGELGMPSIEATIAPAGEPFEAGAGDLAIWRSPSGRLASASGVDATMVETTGPVAILSGAHQLTARIDALLARCSIPEAPQ